MSKLADGSDLVMVTIAREGDGRRVAIHRKVNGVPVVTKVTLKSDERTRNVIEDVVRAAPETEQFLLP